MSNAPCRNCLDRRLGCHGICKEYNAWALEHREKAKWERDSSFVIHKGDFTGTGPKPGKHRKTRGTK